MIYPSSGLSMLAHLTIIATTKVRQFLGINSAGKPAKKENGVLKKMLSSFAIAVVIESVLFLAIGSSAAIIDVGVLSDKSNYNIIKGAFNVFEVKAATYNCKINNVCLIKKSNLTNAIATII